MTRNTTAMAKAQLNHLQASLPLPSGAVKPVLTPAGISSTAVGSSSFLVFSLPVSAGKDAAPPAPRVTLPRQAADCRPDSVFSPSCLLQSPCHRNLQNRGEVTSGDLLMVSMEGALQKIGRGYLVLWRNCSFLQDLKTISIKP